MTSITLSEMNKTIEEIQAKHCVKRVLIRSYSGPNVELFWFSFSCIRTRITSNTDTFHAVKLLLLMLLLMLSTKAMLKHIWVT